MRTIFKLIILVSVFLSLQTSLLATVQFSDITVSNLTSSSAIISFFSDNSVSTNIEYGTDNTALTPASPSTNAKFHSFQLSLLFYLLADKHTKDVIYNMKNLLKMFVHRSKNLFHLDVLLAIYMNFHQALLIV